MISAATPQTVNAVTILNGYLKSQAVYDDNNAIKGVRLSFSNGTSVDRTLPYGFNANGDTIRLSQPVVTTFVRVTILSYYPGNDDADTCISEIKVS